MIKKSRFLATVARADDEAAARAVVGEERSRHPLARHHCTAFIVESGSGRPTERSSDDGEPPGTAGTPMLAQLRGSGLVNVVAVVTRYFGGVKLGT
ncbi:MAG: YigZ family protein, partial [Propionibacteriaceae bacterium]|nr:YigZ family protein [Propionibacteriaceae bacterium]